MEGKKLFQNIGLKRLIDENGRENTINLHSSTGRIIKYLKSRKNGKRGGKNYQRKHKKEIFSAKDRDVCLQIESVHLVSRRFIFLKAYLEILHLKKKKEESGGGGEEEKRTFFSISFQREKANPLQENENHIKVRFLATSLETKYKYNPSTENKQNKMQKITSHASFLEKTTTTKKTM